MTLREIGQSIGQGTKAFVDGILDAKIDWGDAAIRLWSVIVLGFILFWIIRRALNFLSGLAADLKIERQAKKTMTHSENDQGP